MYAGTEGSTDYTRATFSPPEKRMMDHFLGPYRSKSVCSAKCKTRYFLKAAEVWQDYIKAFKTGTSSRI